MNAALWLCRERRLRPILDNGLVKNEVTAAWSNEVNQGAIGARNAFAHLASHAARPRRVVEISFNLPAAAG